MREYDLRISGNDYKVSVKALTIDRAHVEVNGEQYDVDIRRMRRRGVERPDPARPPMPSARSAGARPAAAPPPPAIPASGTVTAPITGAVLAIFVEEGEAVKAGQEVLKLEAMKMENVLNAATDGTVQKVHVKVGDSVGQGQALIDIA